MICAADNAPDTGCLFSSHPWFLTLRIKGDRHTALSYVYYLLEIQPFLAVKSYITLQLSHEFCILYSCLQINLLLQWGFLCLVPRNVFLRKTQ